MRQRGPKSAKLYDKTIIKTPLEEDEFGRVDCPSIYTKGGDFKGKGLKGGRNQGKKE